MTARSLDDLLSESSINEWAQALGVSPEALSASKAEVLRGGAAVAALQSALVGEDQARCDLTTAMQEAEDPAIREVLASALVHLPRGVKQ